MLKILKPIYHFLLAYLGALFYGVPSRKLTIIGVTGTNGKTTVVHLIHHILNSSGVKTGMVSSLQFCVCNNCEKNLLKMTMPGRFQLQKFLRKCVNSGATHAVIEVTSQGVLQHRHRGIKFDYAVLTNVTPEHIEAHGGFEKYRASKLAFFEYVSRKKAPIPGLKDSQYSSDRENIDSVAGTSKISAIAVVNKDDPSAELFFIYPFSKKIKYSGADLNYFNPLLGDFNRANVMAAVKVAEEEGLNHEQIEHALKTFPGVPGRMEYVQREPFAVVVDYAHTPDALRKVYETLKSQQPTVNSQQGAVNSKQLVCVLGAAGGGRDKWKRPEMGKIAAEFCDEIILTNEDPYDENPEKIMDDIASGFSQIPNSKFQILLRQDQDPEQRRGTNKPQIQISKILDRRAAINKSLKSAKVDDVVIITGKGAEPWIMGPDGAKIPWDDRRVVREELTKLNN